MNRPDILLNPRASSKSNCVATFYYFVMVLLLSVSALSEDLSMCMLRVTPQTDITWTKHNSGTLNNLVSIAFNTDSIGLAVGANGSIVRSGDGGITWTPVSSGIIWELRSVCFVDRDIAIAAGLAGQILRSTDAGLNWTVVRSRTAAPLTQVMFIDSLRGFICGSEGTFLQTTDKGANWALSQVEDFGKSIIYCMSFLADSTLILAGEYGQIAKSTNLGASWSFVDQRPTGEDIVSLTTTSDGTIIGVGGSSSHGIVVRSRDNGTTWSSVTTSNILGLKASCVINSRSYLGFGLQGSVIQGNAPFDSFSIGTATSTTDVWGCFNTGLGTVWICGVNGSIYSGDISNISQVEDFTHEAEEQIQVSNEWVSLRSGKTFQLSLYSLTGALLHQENELRSRYQLPTTIPVINVIEIRTEHGVQHGLLIR